MTQAERGLFEQIEPYLNPGEKAGSEAEKIIREFEQRLADAREAVDSNLLVECALADVQYSGSYADGIMVLRDGPSEAEAELERMRALAVNANEFMRNALILDEHGGDDFESECADCRLVQTIVQLCAAPLPEKKA